MKPKLSVVVNSLYFDPEHYKKEIRTVIEELRNEFDVKICLPNSKPDIFGSVSVDERIASINEGLAFSNNLLSFAGGFNSIELLRRFDEIKATSKTTFIGSSDGTILLNALYAQKSASGLYGPDFMCMVFDIEHIKQTVYLLAAALRGDFKSISASLNTGSTRVSQNGSHELVIVGGNNYTFDLLQGTRFAPVLNRPFALLMEGEYAEGNTLSSRSEIFADFIRNVDSVLLQPGAAKNIRALLIGRFPEYIGVEDDYFKKLIADRPLLQNIPVVYELAVGHTKNVSYIPYGMPVKLVCSKDSQHIKVNNLTSKKV